MNKPAICIFALALLMLSVSSQASNPASPQTRCNLTESTAPTVRDLRLGMSAQQFLALFPGISKKKEMKDAVERAKSTSSDETTTLGVDPIADGDARQFAGLDAVSAGFYKGRVVDLSLQYGGATWRTVDEWVSKVSEAFMLPGARDWIVGPNEAPNKVLRCDGILIEAAIQGGSASIRIQNTNYLRESEERARAMEERKRQQVKP